jgi:archaea-specific DNA-binding protein
MAEENQEKAKKSEEAQKKSDKDNIIFIGVKPFMNYVTAVVIQFKNKEQKEVLVSARGKFISKAVDVVEVARRTFLKEENVQVKDIKISSEAFENKEGRRIHVSSIEILLIRD